MSNTRLESHFLSMIHLLCIHYNDHDSYQPMSNKVKMHSFLVLVIFQITVSFGLLLNNVDISDLEIKKNVTTSLPNVRKYLNL